jgi:hypothetical protein
MRYHKARTTHGTRWHLVLGHKTEALCGAKIDPVTREEDDGSRADFCRACLGMPDTRRLPKPHGSS